MNGTYQRFITAGAPTVAFVMCNTFEYRFLSVLTQIEPQTKPIYFRSEISMDSILFSFLFLLN